MNFNTSGIMALAITAAALYAAHKFGSSEIKALAYGAAGYMVANQLPVIRDGLQVQVLAASAPASA